MKHSESTGVAHDALVAKFTVVGVPERQEALAVLFSALAHAEVEVDMVAVTASTVQGAANISVVLPRNEARRVIGAVESMRNSIGYETLNVVDRAAKVSVIVPDLCRPSESVAKLVRALSDVDVEADCVAVVGNQLCAVVEDVHIAEAVSALQATFSRAPNGEVAVSACVR